MEKSLQRQYDEIVGITLVSLWSLASESETINFGKEFDEKNEEHLYLLSVATTAYGVINKPIRFNLPIWKRKKLSKMMITNKVEWKKRAKKNDTINPNDVLSSIRGTAKEITGNPDFSYADIYHEYYERKTNE